jgi:ArsR family transcriptional regulator
MVSCENPPSLLQAPGLRYAFRCLSIYHAAAKILDVDAEQFQRIAKALADPRRFEILEHIAQQSEVGCRRLCGCFPVRQATISHHLKELAGAGLVESRRDGQFVYYRTRPAVLDAYMSELQRRVTAKGKARTAKRA